MFKKVITLGLACLIVTTSALSYFQTPKAEAMNLYGRPIKCGYFGGGCNDPCVNIYTCSEVLPNGVPGYIDTPDELTEFLRNLKNYGSYQEKVGASFIISTMLGYNGGGTGWPVGDNYINEVNNRLKSPSIQINWDNDDFSYLYNSTYGPSLQDDFFYKETRTMKTNDVIAVYNNGQLVYALRRACGNPLGDNNWPTSIPPNPRNWNLSGYSVVQNYSAAPGDYQPVRDAYPGETVEWKHYLRNNGPNDSDAFAFGTRRQYNVTGQVDVVPNPNAVEALPAGAYINTWSLISMQVPNDANTQICGWMAYTNRNNVDHSDDRTTPACVNIVKPIANCPANVTLTPEAVQPGAPFSVDSYITYQDNRAANSARNNGSNYYVRVVRVVGGVELPVYNQSGIPTTVSQGKLVGQKTTIPASAMASAGTYKVYWGNSGSLGNANCGDPFESAYYPYFNVVGGDISAGGSFMNGTTCSPKSTSGIKGWNNGGAYYGAGTQLAALALGQIVDFATATNSADGSSTAPTTTASNGLSTNLAFANASGVSGQLGSDALPCMPDYYSGASANAQSKAGNTLILSSLSPTAGGTYSYNGNLTIYTTNILFPSLPSDGRQITIIVDGDAYIQNDIKYGAYSDPRDIPRFTLIVKGNIYIAASVDELHGVYIAQGGGVAGKGVVNTCSSGFTAIIGAYAACNNQLKIYGAVAAEQIKLQRTWGSLNTSPGAPAEPAESFVYSPELWLANSGIDASGGAQPYDAITTLPPVL